MDLNRGKGDFRKLSRKLKETQDLNGGWYDRAAALVGQYYPNNEYLNNRIEKKNFESIDEAIEFIALCVDMLGHTEYTPELRDKSWLEKLSDWIKSNFQRLRALIIAAMVIAVLVAFIMKYETTLDFILKLFGIIR